MHEDVRTLMAAGERAERAGELMDAYARYVSAGDVAAGNASWRAAIRCFQRAVELAPFEVEAIRRIAAIAHHVHNRTEWSEYATALERKLVPMFPFHHVQLVLGNDGSFVTAPSTGTVLEVMLTGADLLEAHASGPFADLPLALALLVLRRALWATPSSRPRALMSIRVAFNGRPHMLLHENGDWEHA